MIKIDNNVVTVEHFPDGTQRIISDVLNYMADFHDHVNITWNYENDEECMTLWYVAKHLKNTCQNIKLQLTMYYIPNARMDRVKSKNEVFTLKYFADFINTIGFDSVKVLDPHSDVSTALINNVNVTDVNQYISKAIWKINTKEQLNDGELFIYFPDSGAMKRYKDLKYIEGYNVLYGKKVRDWETGKILGLDIYDCNEIKLDHVEEEVSALEGATVLMIDDIISYGGTLAYSADKLRKLGAKNIYAYASHVENSILDEEKGTLIKRFENGDVKCVFTTDSLFNKFNDTKYVEKV